MTLLQEQEQFVDDLKEIENKLYQLLSEHENIEELRRSWGIIYMLLYEEKIKEKEMRENTQS